MAYERLLKEFWDKDRLDPTQALDAKFYFYLLEESNKRGWINPFELQSRITELSLMISRKTIGEVRNRLKQRGLIDFIAINNRPTVYKIVSLEESDSNPLSNCFLQGTIKKHLRLQSGNINGYISETSTETIKEIPLKEKSPTPPKEYIPKELDINNNKILLTRTREEQNLDRFDSLLQQIIDGKEQIWVDQMRKKHGIDNISDYLPSFRGHVIANAKLQEVTDINGFKRYFNNSFRYFSKCNPIELLLQYQSTAQSEGFAKYCGWCLEKAPNIAVELVPLTEEEFGKLMEVYGSEKLVQIILNLNNRKDLIPKYYSLFRTLKNWLQNEQPITK